MWWQGRAWVQDDPALALLVVVGASLTARECRRRILGEGGYHGKVVKVFTREGIVPSASKVLTVTGYY